MTDRTQLDDPSEGPRLLQLIRSKPALRSWYEAVYRRYATSRNQCPKEGVALELGAGVGFAKEIIPDIKTADVLPYAGLDFVFDARTMPFQNGALRFIGMLNVFHHIPDVTAFLRECERCLKPGGRILIVDQHPGWISRWILRYAHHEPFDPWTKDWSFPSTGPLSGANGALAWIVFERDVDTFNRSFPRLRIVRRQTHSPLKYWLAGGLKSWSLLPNWLQRPVSWIESLLLRMSPQWGSFVDVEIERV